MPLIALEFLLAFGVLTWAVWELVSLRREQRKDREKAALALEQTKEQTPEGTKEQAKEQPPVQPAATADAAVPRAPEAAPGRAAPPS